MEQEIFSHDQKTIIGRVRNLTYGYKFLANVIDPEMYNSRIQIDFKNRKAFVLIEKPFLKDKAYEQHVIRQTFNWVNYLIDISFVLVDTLVEFNLAKTLRPSDNKDDVFTFGPGAINVPFETIEITDSTKVEALIKYADIQLEISNEIDNLI
jgi:hypothetical protein